MHGRASLCAGLTAALLLAPAGSALAQNDLYNDYKKDGQVNPCSYSPGQVRKNLRDLPPDVQQYAPGLADQLRRPCSAPQSAPAQQQAAAPVSGGPPEPPAPNKAAVPSPPAPKSPSVDVINATAPTVPANSGESFPDWLIVALGGLAALGVAVILAGRFGGLELESLTRPLRASLAEAGGRAGDWAGDLRDVFRLRR